MIASPFPCCAVNRECAWKKTQKKINPLLSCFCIYLFKAFHYFNVENWKSFAFYASNYSSWKQNGVIFSPNVGKYGPEKLRMRTLFTRCISDPYSISISAENIRKPKNFRGYKNEAFVWNELTLSWLRSLSYRNQSVDSLWKSMDWFLYDSDLLHKIVNQNSLISGQ